MSENWLSSEDSPCLLVCFSLLQLPLSQLCLSSVYLSCNLLRYFDDGQWTFSVSQFLAKSTRASYDQPFLTPHVLSTELVKRDAWYDLFLNLQHSTFPPLFPLCLHPVPHRNQPDVNSGPGGPLPPPPPGQLCLAQPAFYCFAKARMDSPPLP